MNSPTITMPKETAVAKLEEYERAAKENPRAAADLDRGIMQGYRVLARGGRLVDVNEALKAGGMNLAGLPKLAIARAHVERCRWVPQTNGRYDFPPEYPKGIYRRHPDGGGAFTYFTSRNQRINDDRVKWTLPADTFPSDKVQISESKMFEAMVPLVPLPLRPKHCLDNFFILWEASWHSVPTDPYLLRPLAGSLMEIVAEWELTPLEVAAVRNAMQTV